MLRTGRLWGDGVRHPVALTAALSCVALIWCACALALDPSLNLSQYAHTAWRVRDGFTKGGIYAIAQTPDGYIWLGTDAGLYRFDGIRAIPWQPPGGEKLTRTRINGLLVSRDDTLWISTSKGLASWQDGKLTQYLELAGQFLHALLQDRHGTVWVGAYQPGRICAIQGGKVQCFGAEKFGGGVHNIYEDHNGNLWVCSSTGLWRWDFSHPDHYGLPGTEINQVSENESGELLLATSDGLKRLAGGAIQNYPFQGITGKFRPNSLLRTRDGNLWISTHQGLLRLHSGMTDAFGVAQGLSGSLATLFFEDHEGNMWVGTTDGLDRFREYAIPRISTDEGLSGSYTNSVQTTSDGAIWIGTADSLNRWQAGHVVVYGRQTAPAQRREKAANQSDHGLAGAPQSLGLDDRGRLLVSTRDGIFSLEGDRFIFVSGSPGGNLSSIVGDGGGKLWTGEANLGLFHFAPGYKVEPIPWSRFGQKGFGARALLPNRSQGGIWLGFWEGGIAYFNDGEVRTAYTAGDGLGNGRVDDLRFGPRGAMWAATESGLSRIKNGHIATLTSKNGLPCDTVHWTMEDADHSMWLYMPCGLVRIARSEMDAWVSDPSRKVEVTIFDESDGVRGLSMYGGYGPHVAKAADGKIWFATGDGVSVIDPNHLPINRVPPPVHVEQVTADGKIYNASNGLRLPAHVRNVAIDYTALSFVAPEKIHFRYRLEGQDPDWRDVVNDRQVQYSNLAPRHYTFRVMASNNSRVWNEAGASLEFAVLPAFYQTNWFRILCGFGFLTLLWSSYQLRVQQLRRQFAIGLDARLNERTRIAQELHDTLLQNFQGSLFQMRAARNLFSLQSEKAMQTLEDAIKEAQGAINEGRDAIQGLRSEPSVNGNLAELLRATSQDLAKSLYATGQSPIFDLIEEGKRRTFSPATKNEIYQIALELLRNSYWHAQAHRIEAEVRYGHSMFRLRIRDDGKGIDPKVLKEGGKVGHWGLRGGRERADRIGARLDLWSEPGQGTEVQLLVPASVAYENSNDSFRAKLVRKLKSHASR